MHLFLEREGIKVAELHGANPTLHNTGNLQK